MDLSASVLLLFCLVGFLSGTINAIAGGAGLLVLPLLLSTGMAPINALATGKCQAMFGTYTSLFNFIRAGLLTKQWLFLRLTMTAAGSALGTLTLIHLSAVWLKGFLPYLMITMAAYTAFSPALADNPKRPRLNYLTYSGCVAPVIGFYGGFFGPCLGSICAVSLAELLGLPARSAVANAKPIVLVSNLVSVSLFIINGEVLFVLVLVMALPQMLGAYIGSKLVIRKGSKLIKPAIAITTFLISLKLIVVDA